MGICTYIHIPQFLIMSLDNSHMYYKNIMQVKSEAFWKRKHNQDRKLLASFNTPSPILNHNGIDVIWAEIIDHLWTWTCSNHLQLWPSTLVHCPVADSVHASFWYWHLQWGKIFIHPFCWYSNHCKTGLFPCTYVKYKIYEVFTTHTVNSVLSIFCTCACYQIISLF